MHHHEKGREDELHKFYLHVAAITKIRIINLGELDSKR